MGKGTAAMGKKSGKSNMVFCRRCGEKTFHKTKKKCSGCGYGNSSKMRTFSWKKN